MHLRSFLSTGEKKSLNANGPYANITALPQGRIPLRTCMNADLLRQRRNLILISGGLLLFDFADVSVTKVSVLGTELLIGNARVLAYFAWTMWGYFLLRYHQYLNIEGDLGISKAIQSGFEGRARAYVLGLLRIQQIMGSVDFKRTGVRWNYSVNEYDGSSGGPREIGKGSLPLLRAPWWKAQSIYDVAIHTPKATDHVLPFLLALAAPIVSAVQAAQ